MDTATHTKSKNEIREVLETILGSEMSALLKERLNDPNEHSINCLNCGKKILDATEMNILILDNPCYVTCPGCKQVHKVSDYCALEPVANTANYIQHVEKYQSVPKLTAQSVSVRNPAIRCSG